MKTATSRRPGAPPKARRTDGPISSRPLVLVVDDCDCLRGLISTALRQRVGVRVVEAATSEQALKLARRRKFGAVVSDINHCDMNGLEFLRVFKRNHPNIPVIIASGSLNAGNTRRAKRLGAFACLLKPFTCDELVELVQAAIASRKAPLRCRGSSS